jgi:hypothetical protein
MRVALFHPPEQTQVPAAGLAGDPSVLHSSLRLDVIRNFVSALSGDAVEITDKNLFGILLLCTVFSFEALTRASLHWKNE